MRLKIGACLTFSGQYDTVQSACIKWLSAGGWALGVELHAAPAVQVDSLIPRRNVDMPTVVVTGAAKGIGLEFVRQYAADGWHVIATARDPSSPGLNGVAGVRAHPLDLGNSQSIVRFGRELQDESVDLLIHNAATNPNEAQSRETLDPEMWVNTARVNALGPVLLTLALAKNLERALTPKVAAVSSIFGSLETNPNVPGLGAMYAYSMTKAALNMGIRRLMGDFGSRGVAFVLFHPGHVRTAMGGPHATLLPQESVAGMRKMINELTVESSGRFVNYDGTPLPW
jgi:NAD(P)-dependent dehydrogenase (short-subunit alcohol dehydrogenase family)